MANAIAARKGLSRFPATPKETFFAVFTAAGVASFALMVSFLN
jgi:hypothetical protein